MAFNSLILIKFHDIGWEIDVFWEGRKKDSLPMMVRGRMYELRLNAAHVLASSLLSLKIGP